MGQILWTETVIYSFQGGADGFFPQTGLIADSSGGLYGTTNGGGTGGFGTVFMLKPPSLGQTQWTKIVLHNFAGSMIEGIFPQTGVIFDTSSNLYGMTNAGGAFATGPFGGGTVTS
jgi:predicted aconitase with swiveling domain